jgi:hypothetical protein
MKRCLFFAIYPIFSRLWGLRAYTELLRRNLQLRRAAITIVSIFDKMFHFSQQRSP